MRRNALLFSLLLSGGLALLLITCINQGTISLQDDDTTFEDGTTVEETTEEETTEEETTEEETTLEDDDDDDDECTSTLDYPAYIFDTLVVEEFLEVDYANEYLSDVIALTLPPDSDQTLVIFDPDEDVTTGGYTTFESAFGSGVTAGSCYDLDPSGNPLVTGYTLSSGYFQTEDDIRTVNLYFGVTLPLHDVTILGRFTSTFDNIVEGMIGGGFLESDAEDLEFMDYQLIEFLDGREKNYDYDDDGVMDGWTLLLSYSAFQFL